MNPQDLQLAIQALASGVTGLTAQIAQMNQQPPAPEPKADKAGGLLSGFGRVLAQFAAVAGPMAVLGAVMGSVTSGMATLGKAAQLLGTVLSPVLLPAAVLLGTAFVAAADVLEGAGMPALQGFFSLILGIGVPVIVQFVGVVQWAAEQLKDFADWMNRNKPNPKSMDAAAGETDAVKRLYEQEMKHLQETGWGGSMLERYGTAAVTGDWEGEDIPDRRAEALRRARTRAAAGEGGGPGSPTDPTALVMSALRDVSASLKMSIGPKAQIGGLEGIGKAAQLAALNQDPIEARMLKVQEKIAAALEGAIAELTRARGGVYTPTANPGDLRGEVDGMRALGAGRARNPARGG